MSRDRIRNLGITIGTFPTGQHNAITDVPGVLVGHTTILHDQPRVARTGVTAIVPRDGDIWTNYAFAGHYSFNGNGEMTGLLWLEESGMLGSVIGITNTYSVGVVHDALISYWIERGKDEGFLLPVVAETYDGWLNDINAFHVTKEHVHQALANATSGAVLEGNVGGGTGMICHGFKGGIGTASRLVHVACGNYTLGVLVQTNYGDRSLLRVNGAPVGRDIGHEHIPLPWMVSPFGGSIIIIIATDAPLIPVQCKRLARRATVGLARVGGTGHNGSGDIFLAFATGNPLPSNCSELRSLEMVPHGQMNVFFDAVAEAVEEAILNALTMAETMQGLHDRVVHAIPIDELKRILNHYQAMH